MYIFGGFSGLLLNDVLAYTPPSCLAFSNPTLCAAAGPGLRCHWVNSRCVLWEPKPLEHMFHAPFCHAQPGMLIWGPLCLTESNHFSLSVTFSLYIFSPSCQPTFPETYSTITRKCCSLRASFFMRMIIILHDLASEVCLHSIIIGTRGQCCNNYLILK